jgi:hypothetical protein
MYFDKARMERTSLDNSTVTNGLLVVEMLSGKVQVGDNTFTNQGNYDEKREGPAEINLIGDPGNWLTYARLNPYASLNLDKRASNRVGQSVDQELTEDKGIQKASLAGQQSIGYYDEVLGHNIPKVFWEFLNQSGIVYSSESGNYVQGQLINRLTDAGYPVTEPYWVRQRVGGVEKEVMFQAFQRRTLTFTPDNASAFQVEMGNVGRHYVIWRYGYDFGPNLSWSAPGTSTPVAVSHGRLITFSGIGEPVFNGEYYGYDSFIWLIISVQPISSAWDYFVPLRGCSFWV